MNFIIKCLLFRLAWEDKYADIFLAVLGNYSCVIIISTMTRELMTALHHTLPHIERHPVRAAVQVSIELCHSIYPSSPEGAPWEVSASRQSSYPTLKFSFVQSRSAMMRECG